MLMPREKSINSSNGNPHHTRSFNYENLTRNNNNNNIHKSLFYLPPNYYSLHPQPQPQPLLPLPTTVHRSQTIATTTAPLPPPRKNSRAPKKSKKPNKLVLGNDIINVKSCLEMPSSCFSINYGISDDVDKSFSGFVFAISPPPSSLPLPKFAIMSKMMSCKTEASAAAAAKIDAGATDKLRQLLRI
ncbi:hypothetical protein ACFE04_011642 [Oxalis oulophora]